MPAPDWPPPHSYLRSFSVNPASLSALGTLPSAVKNLAPSLAVFLTTSAFFSSALITSSLYFSSRASAFARALSAAITCEDWVTNTLSASFTLFILRPKLSNAVALSLIQLVLSFWSNLLYSSCSIRYFAVTSPTALDSLLLASFTFSAASSAASLRAFSAAAATLLFFAKTTKAVPRAITAEANKTYGFAFATALNAFWATVAVTVAALPLTSAAVLILIAVAAANSCALRTPNIKADCFWRALPILMTVFDVAPIVCIAAIVLVSSSTDSSDNPATPVKDCNADVDISTNCWKASQLAVSEALSVIDCCTSNIASLNIDALALSSSILWANATPNSDFFSSSDSMR